MSTSSPGRPAVHSRARIVAEARLLADEEGLEALTVRRIAQRLGTGQASLYRHIADRGELLGLLAEDVAEQLPRPRAEGDPRTALIETWTEVYDYLARHRWAARIIAEGEHVVPGAESFARSVVAALRSLAPAEADEADTARAYRVLWNLLIGHVLNEHPTGHALANGRPAPADTSRADFLWALPRILGAVLR